MAEKDLLTVLTRTERSFLSIIYAREAVRRVIARQGYLTEKDIEKEMRSIHSDVDPGSRVCSFRESGQDGPISY